MKLVRFFVGQTAATAATGAADACNRDTNGLLPGGMRSSGCHF